MGSHARRALITFTAFSLAAVPAISWGATALSFSANGADGSGVQDAGVPCADGGEGASWAYVYTAGLPGGAFSSLPTDLRLGLDLHSDVSTPGGAWLPADGTSVDLENDRGSVRLLLTAGTCESPAMTFDGTFASGSGTWTLTDGMGSYREATGNGSFTLLASVGPGSDNPFSLSVSGQVEVLQPSLAVEVASASWMADTDPTSRVAAVTYRVANTGPGDAFGVVLTGAGTATPGVTAAGPTPQALDAIPAGEAALVQVTYRFERGPCQLKDHGCAVDADLTVDLADALDAAIPTHAQTLRVRVPTFPGQGGA